MPEPTKRYDINEAPVTGWEATESPEGEWVRHDDHTAEVERLRKMLDAALDDNWEDIELTAYRVARSGWTPN